MSESIKYDPFSDIDVTLKFNAGTDITITGFDSFDEIKGIVWTSNFPKNDLTLNISSSEITFTITNEMTAQMYGDVFLNMIYKIGEKQYSMTYPLNIFITRKTWQTKL